MKKLFLTLYTMGLMSGTMALHAEQVSNFLKLNNTGVENLVSKYKDGKVLFVRNDSTFVADVNEEGRLSNVSYTDDLKRIMHDGQVAYGSKSGQLYYSCEGKLFTAKQRKSGKWVNYQNIEIPGTTVQRDKYEGSVLAYANWRYMPNDSIVVQNPTLNEDETELYFASNMYGSDGMDIYKCTKVADGVWSAPEKLGGNVNSKADEDFPFVRPDGSITFASNRSMGNSRPEAGKYDVYIAHLSNNKKPQLYADVAQKEMEALQAKWEAEAKAQAIADSLAWVSVSNGGRKVFVDHATGHIIIRDIVSDDFRRAVGDTIDKFGEVYIDRSTGDTLKGGDSASRQLAINQPASDQQTNGTISGSVYDGTLAENGGSVVTSPVVSDPNTSDASNEEKLAELQKQKEEQIAKEKAMAREKQIDKVLAANPDSVVKVSTNVLATKEMRIFYFEFNKGIPNGSYKEDLEVVLDFINAYPDSKFLIVGHTDERGSDEYNMALSEKRAEWVFFNLLVKGVKLDRMQTKGEGERHPLVKNAQTEEDHQKNRRVEIHKLN